MLRFVDNFADDASGTNKYAQYQYIGSSMIVSISHPEVTGGLNLSYGASGTYDGWDRFGRIVDQHWTSDSAATKDRIQHSYDRNSNRLTRTNSLNSALDESYTYDGLDRLIDTNRNGANLQDWSLDSLGNWRGFTDGATTQTRANNAANEITGISGVGWIAPVYDAAGNMTSGPKPGDETTRLHFKYDAWNRLAEVKDDNAGVPGTTIASYEYDGRTYRVEKTVGADTSDVYYNEAWQVLEVRHNGDADPLEQNIWDQRYVDAPIVRFQDANTDGDYADLGDSILYYTQDANFNVTALVDAATGNVVERYSYDPYGKAAVYDANWTVRPTGSAYNNELQYAGYRLDPETNLYQVRNRFYHTALATWISRDPIGYEGGLNLYAYVVSNPLTFVDPFGQEYRLPADGPYGPRWNGRNCEIYFIIRYAPSWHDYLQPWWNPYEASDSYEKSFPIRAASECDCRGSLADFLNRGGSIGTAIRLEVASALAVVTSQTTGYNNSNVSANGFYIGAAGAIIGGVIQGFTRHGLNQILGRDGGRGVANSAVLEAVNNPVQVVTQSGGRIKYIGSNATVVLNSQGNVVTAWATSSSGARGGF